MTNSELLKARKEHLSSLDRQRVFVLRVELIPMPCPACDKPVNALKAAEVKIDQYDFGRTTPNYRCPACGAELSQITPPIGIGPLWHWGLKPEWLRARLAATREPAGKPSESVEGGTVEL